MLDPASKVNPVALALLRRELPRFLPGRGPAGGVFTDGLDAMLSWTTALDGTCVAVQGPPGTGETYRGARQARILMYVSGYYSASTSGSKFTALPTARIFDGTVGTTPLGIQIAGLQGVPADATAVIVNTEVFQPSAAGYVRVTPFGTDAAVAVQEFTIGKTISNLVVVKVVSGKIQAKVSAG